MEREIIDFKAVNLNCKVDPACGTDLEIKAESRVSAKSSEDFEGYVFLYMNIKIHDEGDEHFVFDITTETIFQMQEGDEPGDELLNELLPVAQMRTFEAVRDISTGMGINTIDLTGAQA